MVKFIFWSICSFGSTLFLVAFLIYSLIQSISTAKVILLIASIVAFIAVLHIWIQSFRRYKENPELFKFD